MSKATIFRLSRAPALPLLAALALMGNPPLFAQSAPTLAPDSSELFGAFFQFHNDFSNWMQQRKATDTRAAQNLDTAAARHLGVLPGDLAALAAVSLSVMTDLRSIENDRIAHANARARYELFPDPSVLQQLADRRRQAIATGAANLQKVLSPASWTGLHNYINNVHRLRYRRFPSPQR